MLVIARSYGVMVRAFPVAGAEFAYAYHACGRYHAYACGWFLALGYLSIVPLNATALAVLGTFVAPQLFARGSLYTVAGFEVFAGEILLASAAIIGSLPIAVGAMQFLVNSTYIMLLFTDPIGQLMVAGAITVMTIGTLVMRQMVRLQI